MKKLMFALLMAGIGNVQAAKVFYDGNKWLGVTPVEQLAYVLGIVDSHTSLKQDVFCAPDNVTAGQVTDIVKKNLTNHPEDRHLSASSLVLYSLQKAFPCK